MSSVFNFITTDTSVQLNALLKAAVSLENSALIYNAHFLMAL